jgi:hypothetical protein
MTESLATNPLMRILVAFTSPAISIFAHCPSPTHVRRPGTRPRLAGIPLRRSRPRFVCNTPRHYLNSAPRAGKYRRRRARTDQWTHITLAPCCVEPSAAFGGVVIGHRDSSLRGDSRKPESKSTQLRCGLRQLRQHGFSSGCAPRGTLAQGADTPTRGAKAYG